MDGQVIVVVFFFSILVVERIGEFRLYRSFLVWTRWSLNINIYTTTYRWWVIFLMPTKIDRNKLWRRVENHFIHTIEIVLNSREFLFSRRSALISRHIDDNRGDSAMTWKWKLYRGMTGKKKKLTNDDDADKKKIHYHSNIIRFWSIGPNSKGQK